MSIKRAGILKAAPAVAILLAVGNWTPRASAQAASHTAEYKCYNIPQSPAVGQPITLQDQFGTEEVTVQQPEYLCNPAIKTFNGVKFGSLTRFPHLKCYKIVPSTTVNKAVTLKDQFEMEDVTVTSAALVCTEVTKTENTATARPNRPASSGADRRETKAARSNVPESRASHKSDNGSGQAQ
jgi:hypothetical protein